MPNSQIGRLRAALERGRSGSVGPRSRYPRSLRLRVATHARERLARGESLCRVAESLGLALATLQRWTAAPAAARLRSVRHRETSAEREATAQVARPVLVTPRGFRVEGLDVELLLGLLRHLA
jgi:hypothetical protein